MSELQLQKLMELEKALHPREAGWDYRTAIPTFIAALLGLGAALFLDYLKTRRESATKARDGRAKELSSLNAVIIDLVFNIEIIVHTALQQIIPHHEATVRSLEYIKPRVHERQDIDSFEITHEMQNAMRRCPEPYLKEIDEDSSLLFLVDKHHDTLRSLGWVNSYSRDLRFILSERNKLIDTATLDTGRDAPRRSELLLQIENQYNVSRVELINCLHLLHTLTQSALSLGKIVADGYKDVIGPKLKITLPPVHQELTAQLRTVVVQLAPEALPELEPTIS